MTTAVLINHVAAYAAAVRNHLGDLGPEQVEDLTDGLEADLAEALDDPTRPVTGEILLPAPSAQHVGGAGASTEKLPAAAEVGGTSVLDLAARFGPPEAYADELRSAAGIPPAVPSGVRRRRRSPLGVLRETVEPLTTRVAAHPRWPAVREFLVSLRPVWWVARGWALFTVGALMTGGDVVLLPRDLVALALMLLLVVTSVQYGRGAWVPPSRFAGVLTALSVLAIVTLPFAAASQGSVPSGFVQEDYAVASSVPADGVYIDGEPVQNLFVYGADGLPVDGARIVDEDLRPVVVGGPEGFYDEETGSGSGWQPREDAEGREVWNAYPLATFGSEGEWDDEGRWVLPEGATVVPPAPPVDRLTPLAPAGDEEDAAGVATEGRAAPTEPAADPSAPDPAVPAAPAVP